MAIKISGTTVIDDSQGLRITGISTFTNGPIFIGAATSTGTASQPLQVTGGAYVSGNLGIGTTNPTVTLQLSPNARISNVGTGITLPGTVGSALTVAQFYYGNTNGSYLRIKATRNSTGSDWTTASTKLLQVTDVTEQSYIEYNPYGSLYGMAFGSGATEWARFLQSGNLGIGTTNPVTTLQVQGNSTALDTRFQSIGEKTILVNGNTASLVYNTGSGNIAICTNASGNVTLSVTGIPTDSTFDNNALTFSVAIIQAGTARSCTAVTLNGVSASIKWFGGSLANAISGVTTTTGTDIYTFTGINTVGSASTTTNYLLLGNVNGSYR